MSDALLPCVEVNPARNAQAAVVWLHGLGADGHDFEPVAQMLLPALPVPVRFVLPHAPRIPVTLNGGMRMPAWYDMLNLEHPRQVDWTTVAHSETQISALLDRERARGIPADKLFLAGFSQGGAMAIRLGLKSAAKPLAGVLALSTYLLENADEALGKTAPKDLPVFMAHGKSDPIIPFSIAESSRESLTQYGCHLTWKTYPMQHSVCEEEIRHIADWLRSLLA